MYKFGWCLTPETLTTRTNDPLAPQRLVFLRKVHRSSGQVPMDRSCKSCGVLASTNSKNGNRVSICIQQEQSIDFFSNITCYLEQPGTSGPRSTRSTRSTRNQGVFPVNPQPTPKKQGLELRKSTACNIEQVAAPSRGLRVQSSSPFSKNLAGHVAEELKHWFHILVHILVRDV